MKGRVLGVVSPKGGVGKTTLASSLGVFLAKEHERATIILDMNPHTPNVFHYLGLDRYPELTANIRKLMKSKSPHIHTACSHSSGLHVVPGLVYIDDEEIIETHELRKTLNELRKKYDYIILDSPPGMGKNVKQVIGVSDDVLVVTTPDPPSVLSTISAVRVAERLNAKAHLVVNKSTGHRHELSKKEIEKMLGLKVIGEIPFEFKVMLAPLRGVPAVYTSHHFRMKIGRILERVSGEIYREEPLLQRIKNFLFP